MSSLASFLVPKGAKAVDTELDALFKNTVPVKPEAPKPSGASTATLASTKDKTQAKADKQGKKRKAADSEPDPPTPKRSRKDKTDKKTKKQVAAVADDAERPVPSAPATDPTPVDAADDAMDQDTDAYTPPAHIASTSSSNPKHPKKRTKFSPEEETPEMRDARTLFVGNVPVEVMGKKPLIKSLQRHLLSAVPNARAESIRFRSVPLPRDAIAKAAAAGRASLSSRGPATPNHANARTSAWRSTQHDDEDGPAAPAKTYLTPAEKKRIAAITGDLGDKANSVTAYLVLAHPAPRPANLPPLPTADPYAAALAIAAKMDGAEWEGRALRVDVARREPGVLRAGAVAGSAATTTEGADGTEGADAAEGTEGADATAAAALTPAALAALLPDPKRTLFVGNLDYGAREDDVRAFFEAEVDKLVSETAEVSGSDEEGESEEEDGSDEEGSEIEAEESESEEEAGEDEDEEEGGEAASEEDAEGTDEQARDAPAKPARHVARVRIVRDPATGVGKGFAYVQFVDRTPVDELLALPAGALKFAKRKLRVQRCKTVPGAPKAQAPRTPVVVPSGDPTLGSRLAGLPKDARKAAKAADAARVARRAAKKAAKKGEFCVYKTKPVSVIRRVWFPGSLCPIPAAPPRDPMQMRTTPRPRASRSARRAWRWAGRWRARSA
ncbi:hypothetical protein HDZ31DRAFT_82256 [Schizophyllum fasciatum]